MKFKTQRELLLKPIQMIIGAVERRQTMPILSNFLLRNSDGHLVITATDLELEISAALDIEAEGESITVPGRKLLDICKSLPEGSAISFSSTGEKAEIKSTKSRFTLATLAADDFPLVEKVEAQQSITVNQEDLRSLIDSTSFAMAQQDVRYYLNGLLFELSDKKLTSVATDGHRLALNSLPIDHSSEDRQVILPRKAVQELGRILSSHEGDVELVLSTNHMQAQVGEIYFVTKLIDGKFPDYERVIPVGHTLVVDVDREQLRAGLMRASILSNEKYRGIRLSVVNKLMKIQAHNPEQEEAEEELEVDYLGPDIEVGFNVGYLLDVLNTLTSQNVQLLLQDSNSSLLIQSESAERCKYVVMPMRL
jgi:DNA polymerase-3 subunit beta